MKQFSLFRRVLEISGLVVIVMGIGRADILVGAQNDGDDAFVLGNDSFGCDINGDNCLFANLAYAQPFTLSMQVTATQLEVYVDGQQTPQGTFSIQLTNQLGSGTTSSNILAQGNFSFPVSGDSPSAVDLSLGNLVLPPGTYYVVLESNTPVDTFPGHVGDWGNDGTVVGTYGTLPSGPVFDFGTTNNGSGPPLTDFDPTGGANSTYADFLLEGTADLNGTAVPEPRDGALLVGTGLALFAIRRKISKHRTQKLFHD